MATDLLPFGGNWCHRFEWDYTCSAVCNGKVVVLELVAWRLIFMYVGAKFVSLHYV